MTTFTFYGYINFIRTCHINSTSETYLTGFYQWHYMLPDHSLWFRIFQNTFFNHQ